MDHVLNNFSVCDEINVILLCERYVEATVNFAECIQKMKSVTFSRAVLSIFML